MRVLKQSIKYTFIAPNKSKSFWDSLGMSCFTYDPQGNIRGISVGVFASPREPFLVLSGNRVCLCWVPTAPKAPMRCVLGSPPLQGEREGTQRKRETGAQVHVSAGLLCRNPALTCVLSSGQPSCSANSQHILLLQISHFIRATAFHIRATAFHTLSGRPFNLRVLKQTQKVIFLEESMPSFKGSS